MITPTLIWINDSRHELDLARFVLEDDEFVYHIVSRAAGELHRFTEHRSFAVAVQDGSPGRIRSRAEGDSRSGAAEVSIIWAL
jgi:hypothetical protein